MKDNGLKKIMIGALIAGMLAVSGWTLSAIANMPKEYVQKDAFERLRVENREDHKEILTLIRELMTKENMNDKS